MKLDLAMSQPVPADEPSSRAIDDALMAKLRGHARRAAEYNVTAHLRQMVAVPSPNGGYRLEIRSLRSRGLRN